MKKIFCLAFVSTAVLAVLGCQSGSTKKTALENAPLNHNTASPNPPEAPPWLAKTPLIPREVLFGPPQRSQVRLSPDGKMLSYIATLQENETTKYGIFVTPIHRPQDKGKMILPEPSPRAPRYTWTLNPRYMVYLRDVGGNENDQLFLVDMNKGQAKDLTQDQQVKVRSVFLILKHPNLVFFYSNRRDPKHFDLYQIDLQSQETKLVFQNDQDFISIVINEDLQPRVGYKYDADGGFDFQVYSLADKKWQKLFAVSFENVPGFDLLGYDTKADRLYFTDSTNSDTGDLLEMDLGSRKTKVLGHDPKAQIVDAINLFQPGRPLAYVSEHLKPKVTALSKQFGNELVRLQGQLPKGSTFQVLSQTKDDATWLLAIFSDQKSAQYALWDRNKLRIRNLFSMHPELDRQPLVPMHPITISTRDNLQMVSYLTLPPGLKYDSKSLVPAEKIPMVLYVHGGPWARDSWGFDPNHQHLANRGYAVLSVNYRGSTGFGKKFESLSYGEWGGKMHDDLIDATQWAIDKGIADPKRIAIVGASYGGYASLVGLTFTPEVFAAGVSIVGVANLVTMANTIPEYWKPFLNNSIKRMGGDHRTEPGREFLWKRSPLYKVDQIKRPLLIGHGDNDPRVNLQEAIQITDAMVRKKLPVTLVRFPDEGHGFARPENSTSFEAITESFLWTNLGGRSEPLKIAPSSSLNVAEGGQFVIDLCAALRKANKSGAGCK